MPLCLTGNRSMSAGEGRTLFHPIRPPKDRGSWGSELAGRDNRTTQRTEETGRRCGRRVEVKSKRVSCSVMSNSSRPHGLWSARVFCLCNFPGKNTGVSILPFSRGSSPPRDQTHISCIAGRFFTVWAIREAQEDHGWAGGSGGVSADECMNVCPLLQAFTLGGTGP